MVEIVEKQRDKDGRNCRETERYRMVEIVEKQRDKDGRNCRETER